MAASVRFRLRATPRPISVEAYRRAARRALPEMIWTFVDGGAEGQVALRENRAAFSRWRLRQLCLSGVSKPDLASEMAGERVAMPIAIAPTGLSGLTRWDTDVAAARAAEAAGVRLALSTGSSWSVEEVTQAGGRAPWFQLYAFGSRPKVAELLKRAEAAGCRALFVTVDVTVRGNRERERETGMGAPLTFTPKGLLDAALHPAWTWGMLRYRRHTAIHYTQSGARGITAALAAVEVQERHMQSTLAWDDLAWLRDQWKGPLYVKGVLDPDDAERAVTMGAEGVVVSNHGGRQLDPCLATLDALPPIVERLGGRGEVYLDGGVRRGTDVIIALALGAKGVFIGRPYLYGAAVAGQAGIADVLEILRADIIRALVLMGCPSVSALDRSWILPHAAAKEEV